MNKASVYLLAFLPLSKIWLLLIQQFWLLIYTLVWSHSSGIHTDG